VPRDSGVKYVDLDDFSPGIHQRAMRSTIGPGPYPRGAAQSIGTYRCMALPRGGLGPLPKRQTSYSLPSPEGALATVDNLYHFVGFFPFGPIASGVPPGSPDELHIAVEYIYSGQRKFRWYRMRAFDGSNNLDTLKAITSTEGAPAQVWFGMSFGAQRMNPTDSTQPGFPVVGTSWAAGDGSSPFVSVYPDPTSAGTAATNAVKDLSTTRFGAVVMHQGRLVLLESVPYSHGTPGAMTTNEQISFTSSNNFDLGTQQQVFMTEFANGYGAYGSISAGELFLIKQQGGGVVVSGDIANPTVTRLPGVVSMGNISARAASTPVGLVYPTFINGMYVWRGGDTSEKISDQLEDDFFKVSAAGSHSNERVFLAEWADWMVCSNNWLLDTRSNPPSWWRLEDPASFTWLHCHRGFNSDFFYVCAATMPSGITGTPIWHFRRSTATTNYSWLSHPLFLDDADNTLSTAELVLTAQGVGTVIVTIFDEYGTTLDAVTFTLTSSTIPARLRQNLSGGQARDFIVKIVSDGGSTAAPVVYSVRLGYKPGAPLVSP
jgi:hypothetical protein